MRVAALVTAWLLLAACGINEPAVGPEDEVAAASPTATTTPSPTAPATPIATVTPPPTLTPTPSPPPSPEPSATPEPACRVIDDFATATSPFWQVVLDGVMGGRSAGQAAISDATMTVSGTINTNGGGFVMVRRPITPDDLAGATQLRIHAVTDGRGYEVIATDDLAGRSRRVSHFAPIPFTPNEATSADDTIMVGEVALVELVARSFGTPVVAEPFRQDLAASIGIILSDGIDGDFELRVQRIEACA